MSDTQNATCPRCGGAFHCGVNEATPCACGQFTLSADTMQQLRTQYSSCLCMRCLAALQTPQAADTKKPAQS